MYPLVSYQWVHLYRTASTYFEQIIVIKFIERFKFWNYFMRELTFCDRKS